VPTHREFQASVGIGHPQVRRFLDVKSGRTPAAAGHLALEGLWALSAAAAAAGASVDTVFLCPEMLRGDHGDTLLDGLQGGGVPILRVSDRVLRRMVERDGPDGIAAIARRKPALLADIEVGQGTRVVVADRFEIVGNLGTVIRCADGAGAAGVLVVDCPFRLNHPLLLKSSMGTILSMPVVGVTRQEAQDWLRRHGLRVLVADPASDVSYQRADYRTPLAIVLGNERRGLPPAWRRRADLAVSIPMLGVADSLNVGHAAAVLLYESLRHAAPDVP
jgi:TrmH family RNA methyltransferase